MTIVNTISKIQSANEKARRVCPLAFLDSVLTYESQKAEMQA
jgi:hypothetical protein